MSWISDLFKKPKPNLTPSEEFPQQNQLYFTSPTASQGGYSLRDFAAKRIKGEGLGFGDEFVDRQSSPGIAQIDANFQNRTMPTLSSQLSSRGLARSAGPKLATDVIGQADLQRNRDIAETVAKFQYLNELQKKTDQTQALNLAQNLQGQEAGMLSERAAASERLTDKTAAQQTARTAENSQMAKQGLGAAMAAIGGPLGASLGGGIGTALSSVGLSGLAQSLAPLGQVLQGTANDVSTKTLENTKESEVDSLSIDKLKKLLGIS